MRLTSAPCS